MNPLFQSLILKSVFPHCVEGRFQILFVLDSNHGPEFNPKGPCQSPCEGHHPNIGLNEFMRDSFPLMMGFAHAQPILQAGSFALYPQNRTLPGLVFKHYNDFNPFPGDAGCLLAQVH
jgi:hypothetical protein